MPPMTQTSVCGSHYQRLDAESDRISADLWLDHRAVAFVVRLAASKVERHQIGDDVLSSWTRRQRADSCFGERGIEQRTARLEIEAGPTSTLSACVARQCSQLRHIRRYGRRGRLLQARVPVTVGQRDILAAGSRTNLSTTADPSAPRRRQHCRCDVAGPRSPGVQVHGLPAGESVERENGRRGREPLQEGAPFHGVHYSEEMDWIIPAWGRILTGYTPALSIEITRECPLRCPGCYAYGDDHLGGDVTLRQVRDFKGQELIEVSSV